jgi:hypothetical protein
MARRASRRRAVALALLAAASALTLPGGAHAALTPPADPPPGYRGRRPFRDSPAYSFGKTRPLPVSPPLDVGDAAQLAAMLSARAFNSELLIWQFDATADCAATCDGTRRSWLEQAVSMVAQLNDVGFSHYAALAPRPEACAALHATWAAGAGAGPPPACVWSSQPANRTGPVPRELDIYGMWASRYNTVVDIARRGVNVFMHDIDMIFHRDPYADLAAPPLDAAVLIALREGPVNGGMMYVRGAAPNGAALWVLGQVAAQELLTLKWIARSGGRDPGRQMDQNTLGGALRVAVHKRSEWDLWEMYTLGGRQNDHPLFVAHPQSQPEKGTLQWLETPPMYDAPSLAAGCPYADVPGGCARWEAAVGRWALRNASASWHTLHVPPDAAQGPGPSEVIFCAPVWTFTHGAITQEGWNSDRKAPPVSAMTHMLGTETNFAETLRGSHVGRMISAQAAGYISPAAALGAPARARLLHASPDAVFAAAEGASIEPLRALVRRQVLLAALAGLLPVLPEVPCDAAWVKLSEKTPSGIQDHRLVLGGSARAPRCYVSAGGWDSCWPWLHMAFAFDENTRVDARPLGVLRVAAAPTRASDGRVDAAAWAALVAATPGDVLLESLDADIPSERDDGMTAAQAEAVEEFTRVCNEYVCADFCKAAGERCDPFAGRCAPTPPPPAGR